MTDVYPKLNKVLNRTRDSLASTCHQLGIDPSLVDIALLSISSCDNCGYWCKTTMMDIDKAGTQFCPACVTEEEYNDDNY
jgi:hypothetical protein